MTMRLLLLLSALLLVISCVASRPETPIVLNYSDFGPPSAAHDLLGNDWWQWQNHGSSEPQSYDIKVVVYKDLSMNEVQERYAVDPATLKDFRYVEYGDAISYLDSMIEEDVLPILTESLIKTKERITDHFEEASDKRAQR